MARQAAQKEVADAWKKKKAEESRWKYEKEKEKSDVESELESEDPTKVGDDMIFSEEEESREVIATSAERRDPVAASAAGEQEAERRSDIPAPRKCATSTDIVGEREAKRTRSPRPLVASSISSPPAAGATE